MTARVLGTCALLATMLVPAGLAQQACVAGTTIVSPALPTTADSIILRRSLGMSYDDYAIDDIVVADHDITLTFHWDSSHPPIPPPPFLPPKCVYWIAEVGQLAAGRYTVVWRVHDTFLNTYKPAGSSEFEVAAAVPLFEGASRVALLASLLVVGYAVAGRLR